MRVARRFNGTTEILTMQKSVYTHNKKLCVTLAAIVAVFVITTSPNQILLMWKNFGDKHHEDAFQTFVILYSLSTLVHLHSFSNPIIYSLSDSKFRKVLFRGAQMTSLRKTIILSLRRNNNKPQTRDCNNPQLEHNDSNEFHLEEPAHQRMMVHHTERDEILVSTTKFQETYLWLYMIETCFIYYVNQLLTPTNFGWNIYPSGDVTCICGKVLQLDVKFRTAIGSIALW